MKFDIKRGINYDYILTLENINGETEIRKYKINRHENIINKALELLEDKNADASDLYSVVSHCTYSHSFKYCLNHRYSSPKFDEIEPFNFDTLNYRKDLISEIETRLEARKKRLPEQDRNNKEIVDRLKKDVWDAIYPMIRRQKERMLELIIPYIYAVDYDDTLKINNIESKTIAYSNETHGYYTPEHQVNEDLKVKISTNFCYGSSGYFHVIVTYKDIKIIPYSVWVRYYYAGYAELLGYTRSYGLDRSNWNNCLKFLETFINSAIKNPENFIKNEIMSEINGLMDGLEKIFKINPTKLEKEIKVKKRTDDERYIGIRGARYAIEKDEKLYRIRPDEITLIYKLEKLSGSLRFLKSLREIQTIYTEVSKAIDRILEMNRSIYPELQNIIEQVCNELKIYEAELKKNDKDFNRKLRQCSWHLNKLDSIVNAVTTSDERKEAKEKYLVDHPIFAAQFYELQNLDKKIENIKNKISDRKDTKKRLLQFENLIIQYTS